MKTIDLKKLMEDLNLDPKQIAKELFPKNAYPKLALDRVVKGEAFLDTNQLSRLSLVTGVSIQSLYSYGGWDFISSPEGVITFSTGEYKAELNIAEGTTKLYHKGSIFHEEIIHSGAIPLSEYLDALNKLISKHNKS